MEIKSRKREAKRLYPRAQKWSCQTCLFLDSRKPTFELLRNCFSLPSESKNGHACRKNGCPPRVHFQATNVNAISVPSGRIVRRPTRIDTSICNRLMHRALQATIQENCPELWRALHGSLYWNGFSGLFLGTQKVASGSCMCFQASCGEILLAS